MVYPSSNFRRLENATGFGQQKGPEPPSWPLLLLILFHFWDKCKHELYRPRIAIAMTASMKIRTMSKGMSGSITRTMKCANNVIANNVPSAPVAHLRTVMTHDPINDRLASRQDLVLEIVTGPEHCQELLVLQADSLAPVDKVRDDAKVAGKTEHDQYGATNGGEHQFDERMPDHSCRMT
jgi:hypothetical protein